MILHKRKMVTEATTKSNIESSSISDCQAEIERLKIENQSLRGAANSYKIHYNEVKAEAYKEFAERAIGRVEKVRQKYQRLCKEQGEEIHDNHELLRE